MSMTRASIIKLLPDQMFEHISNSDGQMKGIVIGIQNFYNYSSCQTCRRKKEETICKQCHQETETKPSFWVITFN